MQESYKTLAPVTLNKQLIKQRSNEVLHLLYNKIFKEVIQIAKEFEGKDTTSSILRNANNNAVKQAIETGTIVYQNGRFIGNFNAKISKELNNDGFVWRNGGFMPERQLPSYIIQTINKRRQVTSAFASSTLRALEKIEPKEVAGELLFNFGGIYKHVDALFNKNIAKNVNITVQPKFGFLERQFFEKEYINATKLAIKEFTVQQVQALRREIEAMVQTGYRSGSISEMIHERYKVAQSKANFLARQEISLITSKYSQAKYKKVGITHYKWSSSKDSSVRSKHRDLHGKVFRFDDPPVVNEKGERKNPGEDFGCRCVAMPVLGY